MFSLISLLLAAPSLAQLAQHPLGTRPPHTQEPISGTCPQPAFVPPSPDLAYFDTPAFANLSLTRLSGAIAHATVAYDDFGEPEPSPDGDRNDARWDTFPPLHAYLRTTYPLV